MNLLVTSEDNQKKNYHVKVNPFKGLSELTVKCYYFSCLITMSLPFFLNVFFQFNATYMVMVVFSMNCTQSFYLKLFKDIHSLPCLPWFDCKSSN